MKRIARAPVLTLGLSLIVVVPAFAWENRLQGQPSNMTPPNNFDAWFWSESDGLHLRTNNAETSDHYEIAGGTQQTVMVYYDGAPASVQNLHLGLNGVHPDQNSFTNPR